MPDSRNPQETVCLIGGVGRSGTTVMGRVLGRHPQIAHVPELRFLIDPDGLVDFLASDYWTPFTTDRRLSRLERVLSRTSRSNRLLAATNWAAQSKHGMKISRKIRFPYATTAASPSIPNYDRHVDKLLEELTDQRWFGDWDGMTLFERREVRVSHLSRERSLEAIQAFLIGVYGEAMKLQDASHYLEKNTWNILAFDRVLEILPTAKLVHVVRDPRDNVASLSTKPWAPNDLVDCARYYESLFARWDVVRTRVPNDTVTTIRLEDVVANPKDEVRNVLDFFGLDQATECLEEDLTRSNSGRWRETFNGNSGREAEAVLAPLVKRLGYL